ncbi:hypothetical protein M2103_000291 [Ereboglobus sp. PH5-5]|uniref:hypothetical protein n=1 Tax=Ereboglobus sp. PH5-5 TaxID=2940529 RepID=UPI002407162A|nr:hypothetical protein [Ereboglobus sp. PH5-5]MDF9832083.1 hypothetical protein [Ereboglobus sp. PH5-5]
MKYHFIFIIFFACICSAIADGLPKAASGFAWKEFPKACAVIQVPIGWQSREKDNKPAQTVTISPKFTKDGGFDSGFTLNTVVCRTEKEWKDAYYSAVQFWIKTSEEIKKLGKPTFEKVIQSDNKSMQVFVIEGDTYLPDAPHPKEKYRVRTIVRAIPSEGLVFVYSIGSLKKDWKKIWKLGETMLEPIVFTLPDDKKSPPSQ